MSLLEFFIVICLSVVVGLTGAKVYSDINSDRISLIKTNWSCTKEDNILSYQVVGKIMIPRTINQCVQYTRKGN
jgi:hypothetical protein